MAGQIVLTASSAGTVTLTPANTGNAFVVTVPAVTGNLVSTGSTGIVSQAMFAAGVAGNGPAFSAVQGTVQTLSSGAVTKLQLQTELFDTNNNFDNTTNYRFTPTVAGYYQVNASLQAAVSFTGGAIYLYKNGSNIFNGMAVNASGGCFVLAYLVQMNGSTDYLEIYGKFDTGQAMATATFQGFLARAT